MHSSVPKENFYFRRFYKALPGAEGASEEREIWHQRSCEIEFANGRQQGRIFIYQIRPPDHHGTLNMRHFFSKVIEWLVNMPPLENENPSRRCHSRDC